ncbi:hypothetical protein [Vibrio sp. 99-70-13A1]|uniref:hypothetical protein n=1 Tax=Vibrio sp. 99-70-13A1 TaxID=2607601 RepID=UPI001493B751|nr:hypothetical protein [Vibrio sp. 99-70-13A1]NOH98889.1 hypothetical protein [Vibrio sp. 99-70-13A1]
MRSREHIEALEQQIYIAFSEGDYDTVNLLENQIELLRGKAEHPFDDDPNGADSSMFTSDKWY